MSVKKVQHEAQYRIQMTVSDTNGKFSLRVTGGSSVLVFSAVGYITQEISVLSSTEINVTMKLSSQKLDEVVVVGYGTQKKS